MLFSGETWHCYVMLTIARLARLSVTYRKKISGVRLEVTFIYVIQIKTNSTIKLLVSGLTSVINKQLTYATK